MGDYLIILAISLSLALICYVSYLIYNRKYGQVKLEDDERIMNDFVIFKRLFKYAIPHLSLFILALVLIVIVTMLELLVPQFTYLMLLELKKDVIVYRYVLYFCIGGFAALVISAIVQYFQTIMLQKIGQKIIYEIRNDIFFHIENSSTAQLNATPVGKLVTRVTTYIDTLSEMFTSVIINIFRSIVTIIGIIGFMFFTNASLTLYVLVLSPIIVVVIFIFNNVVRRTYRNVRNNITQINTQLSENLSGMKIIQSFNAQEKKQQEFKHINERWRKSVHSNITAFAIFRPVIYILYLSTYIIVFWYGTKEAIIVKDFVMIAALIVFSDYIHRFFDPIQQLADQFNTLQSSFASCEKIFVILDTKSTIQEIAEPIECENIKGDIEFKNVWFAYEGEEWILKDVSFKINSGETVAFVGATGSGKTTILSLIVRNYDIQKGEILIDGINIQHFKLSSLRSQIGQMLQDVFLFSGTIKENITMHEKFDDEKIIEACRYVGADSFIEKLPNRYEETVRQRGNNFSSGQRQLLSFARTIIHQPNVMILDEATANIDTETEHLIQTSLEKMMNIGTMLIVAHRLSTIQHADKIILLSKGVIVETGNHQQLLRQKGLYYSLYQLQYEKKINFE